MIQFQNVKKIYPGNDFQIGEVSFHIEEGEFVFLIGPSGSGKTTLIKMLTREESPTEGKIYFDDRDITNLSRNNIYRLRRQIGVIFQDYKLVPDKNSYENVAFAMEAAGRSDRDIKETVPYVLDIVGLAHRADAFPEQLSGGEKQRIAIARAVANNPRVLIADEPTGNLDPGSAWDIVQILSKINNWGTTVLMSTHGTDIVNTLNKRVIQMEGGQIVRDDNKGTYEITSQFEDRVLSDDAPLDSPNADDSRKGPIKVALQGESQSVKPKKKSILGWLNIWNKKENMPIETKGSLVADVETRDEMAELANQALEQDTEVNVDIEDSAELNEIIADADNTPVEKLNLPKQVVADLQTAGYHDVEDIIDAGPEKLASELIIDPEEVVLVSEAVSEFVAEEDIQIKNSKGKEIPDQVRDSKAKEEKPEVSEQVQEKSAKKTSTRVKLDLAGKNKKD